MQVESLPIAGALLITPAVFSDARGFFKETYSRERYRACGVDAEFVQDNVSLSQRHVLRGLHGDPRMAKLVQVLTGRAFDVLVDLRDGSPTRLRWYGTELSAANHRQLYIPRGFLHGFLALEDATTLLYKQSALYDPAFEVGIAWNDPDVEIAWPLEGAAPLLSPKDAANPSLRSAGLL
ncbi:MAG TPA: dTDP-4-dehydrorhamnose 3,5-epimerase [Verrucomicrobiae bacterium]|nr:dTDP-4-dehydrorhamnose 3,5-epimerase [Verrucomicrobiae bacterium]